MGVERKLQLSLLMVAVLVAAACGTTVPVEQREAAEAVAAAGDDLGGALPEGATINEEGEVVSASGEVLGDAEDFGIDTSSTSGTSGISDPGSTSGSQTTSGGGSVSTGKPASSGSNGPGITSSTIKLGISYADDAEEANRALGATSGAAQINQRRAWEAMLEYINNHGGAKGRKLEPVFHRLSVASSEPYDQQDQEACNHWTQDDPVFIGDGAFKTENGIACFQKNGMVTITTNGLRYKSGAFFERYPTYLEFDGVDNDAIARMYAPNMKKLGFFGKGYKLGILSWTDPEYANPTKNTLVPALQRLGIKVSDVTYIQTPDSGGEAAGPIAQVGNTAVRYKSEGITHVMMMDLGGNLAFFFMQAAERQQYRPRYGFHSGSGNTAIANVFKGTSGAEDARNQLRNSVSVGFTPTIDANAEDVPSWGRSPERQKICYKQMREGGVEMADSNARALAESVCDAAWTIQATLETISGNVINQKTWYEGLARVEGMGLQLTGPASKISPSKRDGLELAARMRFFTDCVCFKYVSGPFQIPE